MGNAIHPSGDYKMSCRSCCADCSQCPIHVGVGLGDKITLSHGLSELTLSTVTNVHLPVGGKSSVLIVEADGATALSGYPDSPLNSKNNQRGN